MGKFEDAKDGFRDVIHALQYGGSDPSSEEEEKNTDADPEAKAPEKESAEAEDTSSDDSSSESKEDESGEKEEKKEPDAEGESESETDESKGQGGDEDKKDEKPADDDQIVEIDGESFTLDELRELRKDGLRHDDFTRKSQANAEARKSLEARDALAADIVADEAMKQFVSAHPEVLPRLLADPENTRTLLGNAEEIQGLWDDYELVKDNPRLAERFHGKTEDATAQLEATREAENINAIANYLDQKVGEIAKGFEGVDADEVRDFVLKLGRIPVGEGADPEAVRTGFGRLFSLMFVQDEYGNYDLDDTLIRNRFEQLGAASSAAEESSKSEADEHNEEVDAKLKDQAPPASKGSGDSPAPEADKIKPAESLDEVIHELLGYGE